MTAVSPSFFLPPQLLPSPAKALPVPKTSARPNRATDRAEMERLLIVASPNGWLFCAAPRLLPPRTRGR